MALRFLATIALLPSLLLSGDADRQRDGPSKDATYTRPVRFSLNVPDDYIRAIAFSPDGRSLAAISHNCRPVVWDLTSGREFGFDTRAEAPLTDAESAARYGLNVVFSPDGKRLATIHQCAQGGGIIF
jgi:WD40 repeat protein